MSAQALDFVRQMEAATRAITAQAQALQKGVEKEVANRLVDYSPVDTGAFRANWQHGAEQGAPGGILPELDQDGEATKARLHQDIEDAEPGSHVFVNNQPYAMALELGHSDQAPHGIVARVEAEFADIVADQVKP